MASLNISSNNYGSSTWYGLTAGNITTITTTTSTITPTITMGSSLYSNSGFIYTNNSEEIDSLKELVSLLLSINGIDLDIDEYLKMDKSERIISIRDIKIKKIIDEPK
jgi:hypothetical protein